MKKITNIIAIIMIAISLMIIIVALGYPKAQLGVPGPGFFPIVLAVLVICLAFALILKQRKDEDVKVALFTKENSKVFLSMAFVVLYILALGIIGYIIATAVFLIALMKLFEVKKWWVIILTSLCTTFISFFVFSSFLAVPLPSGLFF